MSKTFIHKGTQTYEKKGRKVIPLPRTTLPLPLDKAIAESRLPTKDEILGEIIALCSTMLVGMRGSDNVHKSATSIQQIMRTLKDVYAVQKIDELEPELLENMSNDELKEYLTKQVEKLY